jgi:spore coat protein U-like protein
MSSSGVNVLYGLYQDSARTQPWGNTVGTNTTSGTGTGTAQTQTVYGRVAAQATPAPGSYSDSVVVTVGY